MRAVTRVGVWDPADLASLSSSSLSPLWSGLNHFDPECLNPAAAGGAARGVVSGCLTGLRTASQFYVNDFFNFSFYF